MREKLSPDRVSAALAELEGWRSTGTAIEKVYEFATYKDGLVFACAVGYLADEMDHHPDLTIGYRRVGVTLTTHDAGGITEFDVRLAGRIETL
ncbi:MAG: 4a-hydroxytetrahydrobiopterin dehydratase [Fimbriimonadaceae bacterium]